MAKRRPIGVTILAVLVGLGALMAVYHTLQFLHILPFSLGPIRFFSFDLLGALLWGVNAVILIWLVNKLWNVQPEGWLFVVALATINLILAFASILGQSSFSAMLPTILINAIILIYGMSVKNAFVPVAPPAPAAAAPAAPSPAAARAVVPDQPVPPAAVAPAVAPVEERLVAIPEETLEAAPAVQETPYETDEGLLSSRLAELEGASEPGEVVSAPPVEYEATASAAIPAMLVDEPLEDALSSRLAELEAAAGLDAPLAEDPGAAAPTHHARPKVAVETIEGIGPVYFAKLQAAGIRYVSDLLETGASRKGRQDLVEQTGISAALVLKWVNMADLMRISGVGEEYSELLEAAGVDTVKELRNRNPENLYQAMLQANEQRKIVRRTPHLNEVISWVEQAKSLETVMTY